MDVRELVQSGAVDGVYWSIDPELQSQERPLAHATAALVALFLRTRHPLKSGPEFLMRDHASATWYVRWPNGRLDWETAASLEARGFTCPRAPVLQPGIEQQLLRELAERGDDAVGAE